MSNYNKQRLNRNNYGKESYGVYISSNQTTIKSGPNTITYYDHDCVHHDVIIVITLLVTNTGASAPNRKHNMAMSLTALLILNLIFVTNDLIGLCTQNMYTYIFSSFTIIKKQPFLWFIYFGMSPLGVAT